MHYAPLAGRIVPDASDQQAQQAQQQQQGGWRPPITALSRHKRGNPLHNLALMRCRSKLAFRVELCNAGTCLLLTPAGGGGGQQGVGDSCEGLCFLLGTCVCIWEVVNTRC